MYSEEEEKGEGKGDSSLVRKFVKVLTGYMRPKDPANPFTEEQAAENRRKSIIFLDHLAQQLD